jgi:hypothetical protein
MPFFAKFGGGNSNKFGFTRGASVPLTAPTSLSATPVNTSVSISFTAPTNTGGIPITNYEYSFNNSTWTALSPADATSPVTVPGLTQNTGYTVYLRAVNAIGSGPASSGVSFTTQGVPTSAPTSLSAIPVNTSAAISFTAAASSTAITNYEYSFNNSSWTALSPADATSPVTVSGLTQNTAYTVYLRGVNSYGSGPGSTGVSFTTEGVPTGTATISSVPVGTTTATVNFSVAAGGGAITGYDLYIANFTNAWNNTTGSPISVTGLTANTAYVFYVRAKNAYGVGPQSAGFSATTNPIFMSASGGTTQDVTVGAQTYRVHTFTSSGTFTVSTVGSFGTVEYLVVGGGGGGGTNPGGGGGAGGFRTNVSGATSGNSSGAEAAMSVSATAYGVTVGGGGGRANTYPGTNIYATNGGNSSFNGVTSLGGGKGGFYWNDPFGGNGGSGGGGTNGGPGTGTAGQGGAGGSASSYLCGGGGGASGSAGAGNGANGLSSTIRGSAGTITICGGGGGGNYYATPGNGGTGGGGNGDGYSNRASDGSQYGAGGGGGFVNAGYSDRGGGSGAQGVVYIRYRIA